MKKSTKNALQVFLGSAAVVTSLLILLYWISSWK